MADNVFDKLDEQAKVLARIDKNTSDNASVINEMIKTHPSELVEFVKNADRVFIYCGDKSELNRKNKKSHISNIKKLILSLIQIITVLSAIYIPYMWCVLILNLLIYAYPIYKAVTFKPLPYEMKYDEMDKKSNGIYDDNNILCGNDDEKWLVKILRVAAIIMPVLNAVSLWVLPANAEIAHIYLYIFVVIDFICGLASTAIFNCTVDREYGLYFVKDNLSIPYEQLKEFMQQNNLK